MLVVASSSHFAAGLAEGEGEGGSPVGSALSSTSMHHRSRSCGVTRTDTLWLCWQHSQLALGHNVDHCPHRNGHPLWGLRVVASRHLAGVHQEGHTYLVLYICQRHSQTAGHYRVCDHGVGAAH